jgi:hypothetical protein
MNFTAEHKKIIKKNRPYYNGLLSSGTVRNISSVIVDEFQRVYTEAIGGKKFPTYCSACVLELIELVYRNYDQHETNTRPKQAAK